MHLKDCMTFLSDTAIEKEEGVISGRKMCFSLSPTCRCRFLTSCTMCCCSVAARAATTDLYFRRKNRKQDRRYYPSGRVQSEREEKGYLYPHTTTDSLFVWSQWDAAGFPQTITKRTFMAQRYRISFCSPRFHTLFFCRNSLTLLGNNGPAP